MDEDMTKMTVMAIIIWQLVSLCFVALSAFGFVVLIAMRGA